VTVPELDVAGEMLDVFTKYGHKEVDTARMYAGGTSEEFLGSLHWQDRGLVMETKLFPTKGKNMTMVTHEEWTLQPADVRAGFTASLEALKADNVDMFYLHGPDRTVPFEETLREVDKLHKEGKFERFGVSNFFAWEVAQLCEIARKNGWIQPTVYQVRCHTNSVFALMTCTWLMARHKGRLQPHQPHARARTPTLSQALRPRSLRLPTSSRRLLDKSLHPESDRVQGRRSLQPEEGHGQDLAGAVSQRCHLEGS